MALKWPTNNVVSIFADKTIALKMTPRQQAQPNAWLFDNLVV
jgi:hypothetical protein